MTLTLFRIVVATLGLLAASSGASAQAPDALGGGGGVEVQCDLFGLGNTARPGDYAGALLSLKDHGDRVRQVYVRLHVRDADGDVAFYHRAITLNPGKVQTVWLYPRISASARPGDVLQVTVHAAAAQGGEPAPENEGRVGPQVGAGPVALRNVVEPGVGLMGVVGRQSMGLDLYSARPPGSSFPGTAHEAIDRISDLTPADIPDCWLGLASLETLVWAEGEPGELREDSAQAIREWVNRGGHLVIVMPAVGQSWTNPRSNPIIDLFPAVNVERREDVNLEAYREMLTGSEAPLPSRAIVHTFRVREGVEASEAAPILLGPERECVVVRRLVGAGMVTVVGFDLASPRLAVRIEPRALWHRILGKRSDTLSATQMSERMSGSNPVTFSRSQAWLDGDVADQINMKGEAGAGVLLALVVFAAYLVIAGPGGFALLKARGLKRHAWVAFVGAAALFTLVAWGGASALRPSNVEVRHLTIIDHVFGQPVDRARSWVSLYLPTYGEQTVSLGPAPGVPTSGEAAAGLGGWRNALAGWDDPDASGAREFPDSRGYVVETRRPESLTVPARSTVKQFQADWLGGPLWKRPTPDAPISLDENGRLRGVLTHSLPAALSDVEVVLVQKQRPFGPVGEGGRMLFQTLATKPFSGGDWAPGAPLDLGSVFTGRADELGDRYFSRLASAKVSFTSGVQGALDARRAPERLSMLAWHPMLEPPDWRTFSGDPKYVLQRRSTQCWDLGKWFTQPCVIIVGQLVEAPCPLPLYVDGRAVSSRGRTVVRWIYPLTPNPPSPSSNPDEP